MFLMLLRERLALDVRPEKPFVDSDQEMRIPVFLISGDENACLQSAVKAKEETVKAIQSKGSANYVATLSLPPG